MSIDSVADQTIDGAVDVSIIGRKLSVTFERKKNLGDYEHAVTRAWMETTLPADADAAAIIMGIRELAAPMKAAVLDELGIESYVDEQGLVREKVTPVTSSQDGVASVKRKFPGATSERVAETSSAIHEGNATSTHNITFQGPSQGPLPEWAIKAITAKGVTKVFDNRTTPVAGPANPKAPWFKEAQRGSDVAFWAPK